MDLLIKMLVVISGAAFFIVGGYTLSQRRFSKLIGLSGFCISCALYSVGYAIELSALTLSQIHFALKVEYLGSVAMPVFIVILIFEMIEVRARTRRIAMAAMSVIGVIVYALVFTSDINDLYYGEIGFSVVSGLTIVWMEKTILYYGYMVYVNIVLVWALAALYIKAKRSDGELRREYMTILLAMIIPVAGFAAHYMGISPYGMDLTPASLSVTLLILIYATNRNFLFTVTSSVRESIFDNMSIIVFAVNRSNRIIDYNDGFRILVGRGDDMLFGQDLGAILREFPELFQMVDIGDGVNKGYSGELNKDAGSSAGLLSITNRIIDLDEVTITLGGDTEMTFKVARSLIVSKLGRLVGKYVILSDITTESRTMSRLDHLASHDMLTGLLNRSALYEAFRCMGADKRISKGASVLLIDIDHFKDVNDSFGHLAGDDVLRSLSRVYMANVRDEDLVARYGGEEFVVLMENVDLEESMIMGERLRKAVEDMSVQFCGNEISVTISIGIANCDKIEGVMLDSMISMADRALYRAKNNGRNRVEWEA